MINKDEANLVSFKILLTRDNKIVTEFSMLPENMVDEVFPLDDRPLMKTIIRNGKAKLENLHDYLIPTIGDIPPIETIIIEEPDGHGPYGAKGLGEHVLIPTAPAILNAITNATGVRVRQVPATPARMRSLIIGDTN